MNYCPLMSCCRGVSSPLARSKSSSEVELLMIGLGVKDYFFSRLELLLSTWTNLVGGTTGNNLIRCTAGFMRPVRFENHCVAVTTDSAPGTTLTAKPERRVVSIVMPAPALAPLSYESISLTG